MTRLPSVFNQRPMRHVRVPVEVEAPVSPPAEEVAVVVEVTPPFFPAEPEVVPEAPAPSEPVVFIAPPEEEGVADPEPEVVLPEEPEVAAVTKESISAMTKNTLIKQLGELGLAFNPVAKKDELIDILLTHYDFKEI